MASAPSATATSSAGNKAVSHGASRFARPSFCRCSLGAATGIAPAAGGVSVSVGPILASGPGPARCRPRRSGGAWRRLLAARGSFFSDPFPSPFAAASASGANAEKVAEPAAEEAGAAAAAAAPDAAPTEAPAGTPQPRVQKKRHRCWQCRKKVGLLGFECRCQYVFCSDCRQPEVHHCDVDYKSPARADLEAVNRKATFSKVDHL